MKREQFHLRALKLRPDGGVEVTYATKNEDSGIIQTQDVTIKNTVVPHPDLKDKFRAGKKLLINMMANAMGVDQTEEMEEVISCHKYSTKGEGEKWTATVTGKIKIQGTSVAINSNNVYVTKTPHGVDLETSLSELEDEAYKYVFKNKKAQLDINDIPEED